MRIRSSVDPKDMRIIKERLISACRWPEECNHVAFAKSCSRNGNVLPDGSTHVTKRCCPSNHLFYRERHLLQVLSELLDELGLMNELDQANAHDVARCLHSSEQNQHRMNDKLLKVEFIRFSVRKNRDEIIFRCPCSGFDEGCEYLEQPRVGRRV